MKTTFRRRLKAFAQSIDAHGIRFAIGVDQGNIVHRVFWTTVLLSSIVFLGFFFHTRVAYFLEYKTSTMIHYFTANIPLPSVTICSLKYSVNVTRLTVDDIINAHSNEYGSVDLNLTNVLESREDGHRYFKSDSLEFFRSLDANASHLFTSQGSHYFLPWGIINEIRIQEEMGSCGWYSDCVNWRPIVSTLAGASTNVPVQDVADYSFREFRERTSKSVEELGLWVTCGKFDVGCPAWRREWNGHKFCDTITTNEYMFVSMDPEKHVKDSVTRLEGGASEISERVDIRVTINSNGNDEAIPKGTFLVNTKGGTSHSILVHRAVRVIRNGVPYGEPCARVVDDMITMNGNYGEFNCRYWCQYNCEEKAARKLNCRTYVLQANGGEICETEEQIHQFKNEVGSWEVEGTCTADCVKDYCLEVSCDQWVYQYNVTQSPFSYGPSLFIEVTAADSADFMTMEEVPLYPIDSLLAELGGTMGLFVGISLLTILHCAEFLLQEAVNLVTCGRSTALGRPASVGEESGVEGRTATLEERVLDLSQWRLTVQSELGSLLSEVRLLRLHQGRVEDL